MPRATDGHGKTSDRRPCFLTDEAEQLQWDLFEGKITRESYNKKHAELIKQNKWWRK